MKPVLCAVTLEGVELPIIDVTHPAFAVDDSEQLSRVCGQLILQPKADGEWDLSVISLCDTCKKIAAVEIAGGT
ncbi:MAG: hypothetical protein JSS95_16245 [Acidobacteria bacterium]|nr:hypothetical protein [Acidobacteriota bacterium]